MKIDFNVEQLQILDKAIQQLPFYIAAPLIEHINKELEKEKAIMDNPVEIVHED
jgi:precorrin-4 methylase